MDATDYEDFDIDRSTAQAWTEFQTRLSEVLSVIDDTADLVIGVESEIDDQAPFIRCSAPRRDVVRLEAASNAVLGEAFQLSTDDLALMETSGWNPPGSADQPETPADEQTPNFWVERAQEECDPLAELAVVALRDVYGIQHPVFLAPDQLAEVLTPKPESAEAADPALDADDVVATVPRSRAHLDQLVDAELTQLFGHRPIRDGEGDVAIRVGSTMLFLRTAADAREVVIFSTVVHEVAGRSRAAEVLNDLNCDARWVKFQLIRDRVFVTLSIPAHPFVPAHLLQGVQIMSEVADGIDDELAVKLNGRTTFENGDDAG
ncbi:hypothetical protein FHX74_003034 [Friedmanniella endophytica]|uniref:Uncharacterized protein n=1 Tax=Microlunatus kandeliicorticis TaxID=1759536 RepID=A0A7W3IUB0_9ACTN|nr:hypothetical protein [Microlunatus kandeliicorticis]MBA8795398.1 hypothetical protein [Microlunatus kandeliicorticis]